VAVRDLTIQRRENDLAVATFGRGFYILDDFTPLRNFKPEIMEKEAFIFPIKDALLYIQTRGKGSQGSTYFAAKNPPYGATFTYYLKEGIKTKKQQRKEKEKKQFEKSEKIKVLTWDELREEDKEEAPHLIFTIYDENDNLLRKLTTKPSKGINRFTWNLRYPSPVPVNLRNNKFDPLAKGRDGILAAPGTYKVALAKSVDGEITELVPPTEFKVVALANTTLPAGNRKAMIEFLKEVGELAGTMQGAIRLNSELSEKIEKIVQTLHLTPKATPEMIKKAKALREELEKINFTFYGHPSIASWEEVPSQPMPLNRRLNYLMYTHYSSTAEITQTEKDTYQILREELPPVLEKLKRISEVDIKNLESEMEKIGAPWTPGRIPELN
ncbi:MAG: hypothetical protein KAU83_08015, partial [Bacteroidales bacterium]|nr:hypothetical protein [Bacteroidales bacterium]